ncbi:MAG: YggS family pyridoxal phosphate-dependent enzyme [Woeseia sp.]|nr:YggS family pyridoxal phosphate-dependent enzyme [Woeseia sp.]MBT8096494.1 YggS family pyridoxal phosphate-dependent enzyme [Woeseia sp.]NNL54588.1 YggS family pyridoxal phosphate-dependent enzyme [Woeseia sp.]
MIKVTENLGKIQEFLATATRAAGRPEGSVQLMAVSKRQPLQAILALAAAGHREFGENFVQEGVDKINQSGRDDLVWHFIGHLQSNKTRQVAEHFHWVHTVDRLKIARRLSEQRPAQAEPLNICLQVNIDSEDSKSGVSVEDVAALAAAVAELPQLNLRGLMCIPRVRHDPAEQRIPFRRLANILGQLNAAGMSLDTLSMGMTADYAAAISEGATIVRIGTALFGARD